MKVGMRFIVLTGPREDSMTKCKYFFIMCNIYLWLLLIPREKIGWMVNHIFIVLPYEGLSHNNMIKLK